MKLVRSLALGILLGGSYSIVPQACAQTSSKKEAQANTPVKAMNAKELRELVWDYKEHPSNFVFKGSRPVVLDFYANWCGPCRSLAPKVADMARKYEGKIDFYKINIDDEEELAQVFGIRSIPTLLFVPMKGMPIMSKGDLTAEQLEKEISRIK